MSTQFKPKSCPKCKRNHTDEGLLCSFCRESASRALEKTRLQPDNYWVQCLIERDGDTVLGVGLIRYTFKKNRHGHSVCEIINPAHYHQIIKSGFYRPYVEPERTDATDDATDLNAGDLPFETPGAWEGFTFPLSIAKIPESVSSHDDSEDDQPLLGSLKKRGSK